jgi:hypothetical protein
MLDLIWGASTITVSKNKILTLLADVKRLN